uniref:Uncharacterized protein n=1 Tax=Timema cristinae TaxID=61476 RepID=A0A7R9GRG9_TIMCR|nr:unnamed protein product [Timema cristinae]
MMSLFDAVTLPLKSNEHLSYPAKKTANDAEVRPRGRPRNKPLVPEYASRPHDGPNSGSSYDASRPRPVTRESQSARRRKDTNPLTPSEYPSHFYNLRRPFLINLVSIHSLYISLCALVVLRTCPDHSYVAQFIGMCRTGWSCIRTSQDAEAQTVELSYQEKESQSVAANSIETQTEDHQPKSSVPPYVDEERLAAFLKRICPAVLKELDKVNKSRAFIGYEPIPDDTDGEIKQLHTLETPIIHSRSEVKVSGLSWSCSGGAIALGYSHLEHDNWCDHNSSVQLYNINRADTSPTTSYKTLKTSSCVTSLKAHPSEPSILAVGTFSGELLVWNLQSEDEILVGSSAVVPGSHREAITHVSWIRSPDPTHQRPLLVTSSSDGRVLVWSVGSRPGSLRLVDGTGVPNPMPAGAMAPAEPLASARHFLTTAEKFVISMEYSMKAQNKVQMSPLGGSNSAELGVTCFSFSPHDPTSFVVGVEGGTILKCSTITAKSTLVVSTEVHLRDPVLSCYDSHQGAVTCINFSPHLQGVFLTCSTDKEIHIYHTDQPSPAQVFYSDFEILGVSWCPSHPHLFAAWGMGGTVDFFDLKSREVTPVLRLYSGDKPSPVSVVSFNPSSNNQLAAAKLHGKVIVWKIPVVKCVGHVAT